MADPALLVGGVQKRLSILKGALQEAGWKVHTSLDPKRALAYLKAGTYAAVFCDEELKGASPAGLLVWSRRLKPDVPFYLFAENLDLDKFKLSGPPTSVLAYPPVAALLPAASGTPHPEERLANTKTPLSGNTATVAITDVIEMLAMTKQNATIEFDFGKTGALHLKNGMLEHATCYKGLNPTQGLKAVAFLVTMKDSEFRVTELAEFKRPTVRLPASTALTEAARIADEEKRLAGFVANIRKACPELSAAAIGYAHSTHANQGFGDADELFKTSKAILEGSRDALSSKVNSVFVNNEDTSYAVVSFNEGNLICACAPVRAKAALTKAVWDTVQLAIS